MLEANKKFIKATLTQGTAHITYELIQLYTYNLNAIGTQAALIAGFAFTALSDLTPTEASTPLQYFYYIFFTLCLITALFVLTQATITAIFGTTLSIKGKNAKTVEIAAKIMKDKQVLILQMGSVCITSLFIGGVLQSWSLYPTGIAIIVTILYVSFWISIVCLGKATWKECNIENEIEEAVELPAKLKENEKTIKEKENEIQKKSLTGTVKFSSPKNISGSNYMVLDDGKFYIYKDEKCYKFQENCITKAINLNNYKIRDDKKRISTSTEKSDSDLIDIILEPSVETEIEINPVYEFKAPSKWKQVINDVVRLYKEIGALEKSNYKYSVEDTVNTANKPPK